MGEDTPNAREYEGVQAHTHAHTRTHTRARARTHARAAYLEELDRQFADGPRVVLPPLSVSERELRDVRARARVRARVRVCRAAVALQAQDALAATMQRLNRITAWIMQVGWRSVG